MVAVEDTGGGPTDRRQPDEFRTIPKEVLIPHVLSGVKQPDRSTSFWVDPREVRAFAFIAPQARPGQIIKNRRTAVLLRANMVQLETQCGEFFRKMAVFATETSALPYLGPESRPHAHRLSRDFSLPQGTARLGFEKLKGAANSQVIFKFPLLLRSQATRSRFGRQNVGSIQVSLRKLQPQDCLRLRRGQRPYLGLNRSFPDGDGRSPGTDCTHNHLISATDSPFQGFPQR
jgi:hypothetical protein